MSDLRGDLSKARRVVKGLDGILSLLDDEETFGEAQFKTMDTIINNVTKARQATANLMQELGDNSEMGNTPAVTRWRS